jgi:hypothetical protein
MTPRELLDELARILVDPTRVRHGVSYGRPTGGMLAQRHIDRALESLRCARAEVRPFVVEEWEVRP